MVFDVQLLLWVKTDLFRVSPAKSQKWGHLSKQKSKKIKRASNQKSLRCLFCPYTLTHRKSLCYIKGTVAFVQDNNIKEEKNRVFFALNECYKFLNDKDVC